MKKFCIDDFLLFEEENGLFECSINNWQWWAYIRVDIYENMVHKVYENIEDSKLRRSEITFRKVFEVIKNCSYNHPILKAKQKDILIFTGQTRNDDEGKYECRITDDIIAEMGDNVQSAEFIYEIEWGHMEPVKTKALLKLDYMDVIPTLLNSIYTLSERKILDCVEDECKRIYTMMLKRYGTGFDLHTIVKRSKILYIRWRSRKGLLRSFLQRTSPKVLVEVCSYSASRMIMNEVAHDLGIKIIELQHGVISPGHIGYNFLKKRRLKCAPDFLFVFSDFWRSYARFIQPVDNIVSIGFPYFDKMINKYSHIDRKDVCLRILVLSQHTYTDLLFNDIKRMIDVLKKENVKFHIVYKLHPRESSSSIKDDVIWDNENIELVDDPADLLYKEFSNSDIQIGICSTALYEGLGYGLRTYILNYVYSDEYMGRLCEKGYAKMVGSGEEIARLLLENDANCGVDGDFFFKPNALKNATDKIVELAGK